jgi:hypothetical protein
MALQPATPGTWLNQWLSGLVNAFGDIQDMQAFLAAGAAQGLTASGAAAALTPSDGNPPLLVGSWAQFTPAQIQQAIVVITEMATAYAGADTGGASVALFAPLP